MNILTYVFSFLLIIALALNFLSFKTNSFSKLEKGFIAYFDKRLKSDSQNAVRAFNASGEKKEKNAHAARKLPLKRLFQTDEDNTKIKLIFQNLLKKLYGNHPLFKDCKIKNIESALTDAIIKAALKDAKKGKIDLEALSLEEDDLQEIYYRIIGGTKNKNGNFLPRLLNYVDETADGKICFFCAKMELILTLLPLNAKTVQQKRKTLQNEQEGISWLNSLGLQNQTAADYIAFPNRHFTKEEKP